MRQLGPVGYTPVLDLGMRGRSAGRLFRLERVVRMNEFRCVHAVSIPTDTTGVMVIAYRPSRSMQMTSLD